MAMAGVTDTLCWIPMNTSAGAPTSFELLLVESECLMAYAIPLNEAATANIAIIAIIILTVFLFFFFCGGITVPAGDSSFGAEYCPCAF